MNFFSYKKTMLEYGDYDNIDDAFIINLNDKYNLKKIIDECFDNSSHELNYIMVYNSKIGYEISGNIMYDKLSAGKFILNNGEKYLIETYDDIYNDLMVNKSVCKEKILHYMLKFIDLIK